MDRDKKQFLAHKDLSKKAEKELDQALSKDTDESLSDAVKDLVEESSETGVVRSEKKSVEERKEKKKKSKLTKEAKILESNRQDIRVLLLTNDAGIYLDGSEVHMRMQLYGKLFDELHIIVLCSEGQEHKTTRMSENVWVYPTNSRSRFFAIYDAYKRAEKQLSFASGFRTDLILALDPFESGVAGVLLSKKFKRALQIEIAQNPFDKSFVKMNSFNRCRKRMARYVLKRITCGRTTSEQIKNDITRRYKTLKEKIDVVPSFIDLDALRQAVPVKNLSEIYPQFKFFMLTIADLSKENDLKFNIAASAEILRRYPSVAYVIVGDGPERHALEKIVSDLSLNSQVIFEGAQQDTVSYLKSANILLNTISYEEYNEILIKAAAAGLPVLTANVGYPGRLFEDGISGMVCKPEDINCYVSKLNEFLSNNQLRSTFSLNAQDRVFKTIETDVNVYLKAYRGSMERCIINFAEGEASKTV